MGYSAELRTSSRQQQSSKAVKEKAISSRANQNLKFQDKHQVENTSGQPYTKWYHEIADGVPVVQLKPSGNHQKQLSGTDTKKDDELVKHMSNLPDYLQKIERGENFQEKALNFGVLDWKRLERWKHNEKLVPERGNMKASSPGSSFMGGGSSKLSSTAQSKTSASQKKQQSSHSWRLNPAHEERHGFRPQGKVTKPQGFETGPWNTMDGKQNLRWNDKSSGRKYSEIQLDRGKKKESDHMTTSKKETSSSNRRKHGLPMSPHYTMSAKDGETNTPVEEELDVAHQSCGKENIVLLLPKSSSRKSFSESSQLSKSKSFDGNLAEAIGKRLSGCFSPGELHPVELYSEIPHSCPLPINVASNTEFDMEQCGLINSQGVELQFDSSQIHQRPEEIPTLPSKGNCPELNSSNIEASTTTETPRRCDQDIAEHPATKGRHPSPSRRFSFSSIGRMTRSFSFKEGSAVPQLSSSYATVKSGPVGSAASADLDKFSRDNASAGSRSRSSPLRRLLDPLLKPRGVHSSEPSDVNLNSVSFKPLTSSELLQNQKCETSSIQALLQLTLKNGLPLFKLVVDNSTDILAAAVKKLPTLEEDVSSLIYALYTVHEIKRKSGNWMTQGSKGKSSSLGYNIVGQMKVSSSRLPDTIEKNMKDQYVVRESILYGVDILHGDKAAPKLMPSRELAAIVIKNPTETNNNGEQIDNSNLCSEDGFMEYLLDESSDGRENEVSNSTTVILPGGIHGLPNEGLPSPLINRWRSGGSCDCGGWDIGCKLQILTNQCQNSKNLGPLVSCSTVECLDLFVEVGHKEKPIFSLALFKSGVYSVEFNPSISLLQAFFISVAFLTSQKLSHLFEVKLEAKSSPEPTGNTIKTPTTIQGNQAPPKYVTNPPPSPVGRV